MEHSEAALSQMFEGLKSKIINTVISVVLLVTFPLLIASVYRTTVTGWKIAYTIHLILYFALIVLFINRKRLHYKFKIWTINSFFIIVATVGVLFFGVLGKGYLFYIIAVVYTGLFIGKKEAVILLSVILVILIFIGFLFYWKILNYNFNVESYIHRPLVWIIFLLTLVSTTILLFVIDSQFISFFIITEKKLIGQQEQISKSERNYREIFNATSEAIFIHSAKDGIVLDVNDAMLHMFNCKREDIIGKTVDNLSSNFLPYTINDATEKIKNAQSLGVQIFEWQSKKLTGELFWTEVSLHFSKIGGENRILAVVRDISERKKAEKSLKESEERFRLILENMPILLNAFDEKGNIVFWNKACEVVTGYGAEEIINNPNAMGMLYPDPEYRKKVWDSSLDPKKIDKAFDLKTRQGKKRTIVWFDTYHFLKIPGWASWGMGQDITERRLAEAALQESEERFRLLIENIPAVTWISNEKGETTYISPNIEKVYGYSAEEIARGGSDLWFGRIHPEDIDMVKSEYQQIFNNKNIFNIEYRIRRKDGKWIWLQDKANIFHELAGVKYAYGVFSDITREKEAEMEVIFKNQELLAAEEEIRASLEKQEDINAELEEKNEKLKEAFEIIEESELKYHSLFNNANDAIFIMKNNTFIECNQKTLEMFDCQREQIINRQPYIFSPEFQPDGTLSKEKAYQLINLTINGIPQRFEWQHCRLDKSIFEAEVSLNKLIISNEIFLLAIVRDITERKKIELNLKEREKNFREIFNSSTDGILITDFEQNILNANNAILNNLNLTFEEFKSKKTSEYILPEYLPMMEYRRNQIYMDNEIKTFEIVIYNSKEKYIPVELNSTKIVFENKAAMLTIVRDISERKKNEQKIINAIINTEEKERNRFAKELHDGLGPILSTIKLYYQWLSETSDPKKRNLIIKKGVENIEEAISSLREISYNLSPHVLDNFGLCDAIELFANKISASKEILIQFQTNTRERFEKEIEITFYRVITELINNTLKHAKATEIKISVEKDAMQKILFIKYTDNGIGFNLQSIKNKKTGLGLFNMENRIRTIGGTFEISSELNKGMLLKTSIKIKE